MDKIGLAKTTASGYIILLASAAGLWAAAASLFASSLLLSKAFAAVPALVGTVVLGALWRNQQFG